MEIYRETMIRSISLSISNYLHSDHSISKIHEISTVLCQFGGFQLSSRSSIIQSSMHRGCRAATEMLPHIVKILEILPAKPWTISSTGGFMEDIQLYLMGCVNQFITGGFKGPPCMTRIAMCHTGIPGAYSTPWFLHYLGPSSPIASYFFVPSRRFYPLVN